jgi:hypothetical protein
MHGTINDPASGARTDQGGRIACSDLVACGEHTATVLVADGCGCTRGVGTRSTRLCSTALQMGGSSGDVSATATADYEARSVDVGCRRLIGP